MDTVLLSTIKATTYKLKRFYRIFLFNLSTVNETLIRSYYVGDSQLYVDEWGASIDREGEKGFETRTFARGSCIPFSTTFVGENSREGSTGSQQH